MCCHVPSPRGSPLDVEPFVGASGVRGFLWSAAAEGASTSSTATKEAEMDHEANRRIQTLPTWSQAPPPCPPHGAIKPRSCRSYHRAVPPPSLGVALAHPLTEPFQLPLSPIAAATAGGALGFLVAMVVPRGVDGSRPRSDRPVESWMGPLAPAQIATR